MAETEVFISKLIKTLDSESALWVDTLILEVLEELVSSPSLLFLFYTKYDLHNSNSEAELLFKNLVQALGRYAQLAYTWSEDLSSSKKQVRYLEQSNLLEAPPIDKSYLSSLIVQAFLSTVDSFTSLFLSHCKHLSPTSPSLLPPTSPSLLPPTSPSPSSLRKGVEGKGGGLSEEEGERRVKGMVQTCWPSLMASFSMFLGKASDALQIQQILNAHLSLFHICGTLSLSTPAIAFLTSITNHALPSSTSASSTSPNNPSSAKKPKKKSDQTEMQCILFNLLLLNLSLPFLTQTLFKNF